MAAVYNRGAAMGKRVYLQTYGCQMNERDSEEILGMLAAQGYAPVPREDEADVILLNTCSVRAHAEERAFGKMAILQRLKETRPDVVLGVLGCMAKAQREDDLPAAPRWWTWWPGRRRSTTCPTCSRRSPRCARARSAPPGPGSWRSTGRSGRWSGSRPATGAATASPRSSRSWRGATRSAPTASCRRRGARRSPGRSRRSSTRSSSSPRAGYRQVTLLGQNVNSYGKRFPDGSGYRGPAVRRQWLADDDERLADFPALLRQIDAKTAIERVRFTTSHPFDAHDELFRAMADCPSVCEYLHLPVQSGSDRILQAMRRGYTAEAYRAKVARLRELVPGVALSTDVIVGFPGESEADFEATVALMAAIEYDSAFLFKYSPRPGTEAAGRADDVPRATKERRHQALLALQGDVSRRKLESWVGREVEVLVTERNRRGQLAGHTRQNVNAVCDGPDSCIGELVGVAVERATPTTLVGRLVA